MKYCKNKRMSYKKLLTCSLVSLAAVSSVSVVSYLIGTTNNNISLSSQEINSTSTSTNSYDHTNYFALPSNMPSDFNGYNLFAQTNNSQFVQTNLGMLGISSDNTTFYLTTYSGRIVWAQQFKSNNLVKKFYATKGWTDTNLNNLTIKEWTILSVTNKTLAILLGDGTNQFISIISLDTGLFLPNNNNNYQVNVENIFKDLPTHDYTNISRVGSSGILVWKNNGLVDLKYFTVSGDNISPVSTNTSSIDSEFTDKKILSFISNANHLYVLYVSNSSYDSDGSNYKYKQYIVQLTINNGTFSKGTVKNLGDYISGSTLGISNFKNRALVSDTTRPGILSFLDGSDTHNNLNVYSYDNSGNLTSNKTLSLEGNTIASISKSSSGDKIYIANNSLTNGNTYLGYVDLSQTSLSISSIRQSTDTGIKNYFLIPILSYTSSNSSSPEYLLLQDNSKTTISYISYSSGNYSNLSSNMSLKTWKYNTINNKTIWDAFGNNYLPNSFSWSTVSSYFDWSKLSNNGNPTFTVVSKDDNNGTLTFKITFRYSSTFNSSYNESFDVYFYINNLYALSSNFVFNWLDSTSTTKTTDDEKIRKITEFKNSKYASQISADDIIQYFISYNIKKVDGTALTIESSMISLSYSSNLDTLTVKITIPTNEMPNGFSNISNRVLTKTYTGFMSLEHYLISSKSTNDVTNFTKTIYPSKLTKQNIIDNFLNVGSSINKTESNWTINILDVNDLEGSVKISVSYNNTSNIPNFNDLPDNVKNKYSNIIHEVTYTGFKNIKDSSSWTSTPTMTSYSGSYLPSEIWGQYQAWLKNKIKEEDVILLQNLTFSLTDKNNLVITCLNEDTCDSDGYLNLEFSIKDNSITNVSYEGTQYKTDSGKLIFNEQFLESSGVTYPYQSKWNIKTDNKYFYLVNRNNGSKIDSVNNEYKINVKLDSPFTSSISNNLSSSISKSDIEKLIDTEGYNYEISLQSNVKGGYTIATIHLSLKNPPLYEGDNINNANFTRTIYIYNFKVPMPFIAKIMILITIGIIGLSAIALSIWFILWKCKLINYKNKSYRWEMREKQKNIKNQMDKKNRFIKKELEEDKY